MPLHFIINVYAPSSNTLPAVISIEVFSEESLTFLTDTLFFTSSLVNLPLLSVTVIVKSFASTS